MRKVRSILIGAAIAAAPSGVGHAFELEGSVAVTSDYRWRGVSLSDEDPALQLEGSASFDNGAWLWSGLNTVSGDLGGSEIGLGLGVTRDLVGATWTLGATHYLYPGEDGVDYTELAATAEKTIGALTLSGGIEYTPEQTNYDDDDVYLWAGWDIAAPHDVSLHGHVGYDDGVMAPVADAIDFSLGASVPIRAVALDVTYHKVESVDGAFVLTLRYAP